MQRSIWLIVSGAVNLVLLGMVLWGHPARPASTPGGPAPAVLSRPARPAATPSWPDSSGMNPGEQSSAWTAPSLVPNMPLTGGQTQSLAGAVSPAKLFPPAFTALIEQLRSAGVPRETLVNFVLAEWQRQLQDQSRELQRRVRRGDLDPREQAQWYYQMQDGREQTVRSLLGDDAYEQWDKKQTLSWQDVDRLNLTPTESDTLYHTLKDHQRLSRDMQRAGQMGEIDPTDLREEQTKSQADYDAQLKDLLGQSRYDAFKQANDWNYGRTRRDLRQIQASDSQIDAVYQAGVQYNEQQQAIQRTMTANAAAGLSTADQSAAMTALQQSREQNLQSILGAQGYADYKKVQDSRYQQMKLYAPAWQLSDADIEKVYSTVATYQQTTQDSRKEAKQAQDRGETVDWNYLNQNVEKYKKDTELDLQRLLGEDRYKKLKRAGVVNF